MAANVVNLVIGSIFCDVNHRWRTTELESLFSNPASEGKEFVINLYRSEKQNLRTTLEKIFNRAKLRLVNNKWYDIEIRISGKSAVYLVDGITMMGYDNRPSKRPS